MNQNSPEIRKKRMGNVTFNDDKLRVNYTNGTESVLFEDIASISYRLRSVAHPLYMIGGSLIGMTLLILSMFQGPSGLLFYSGLIVILVGFIIAFSAKLYWEDVDIETTGGKIIYYSVDKGNGANQMEKIENAKRERLGK